VAELVERSKLKYGKCLCVECAKKIPALVTENKEDTTNE
jgi:hypothetical protein